MLKKLLIFTLLFFVIISINVNADAFATIAQTGLSFVNPTASAIVNGILCVTGPAGLVTCATNYVEGKIVSQVTGEVLQQLAKASPETYKSITTYNQIKGYIDQGSQIIEELELDNSGKIKKGKIDVKGTTAQLGTHFGFEKDEDVLLQNVLPEFNDEEGYNLVTFMENGKFWIKQNGITAPFDNIKAQDENTNAYIKLDTKGKIIEADFTANEKGGIYTFDNLKEYSLKAGQRIVYKNGIVAIIADESSEKEFGYFENLVDKINNRKSTLRRSSIFINDGYVEIEGDKIRGNKFRINNDIKVMGLGGSGEGEITFVNGKVISIKDSTDATIQGVEHQTFGGNLNLYYDGNFDVLKHKNENYFNYGNFLFSGKIQLAGNGFTSILKEDNSIFPGLKDLYEDSYAPRKNKLEFTLEGGSLEVTKAPGGEYNLALNIKGGGNFNIKNGKWDLITRDDNIYANIGEDPEFGLTSDMRFNYNYKDDSGKTKTKIYDLSASSTYKAPLSEDEKEEIIKDINNLEKEFQNRDNKLSDLLAIPEIKEISNNVNEIEQKISKNTEESLRLEGQLIRAERAGTPEQVEIIRNDIKKNNEKYKELRKELNELISKSEYEEAYRLENEIRRIVSDRDYKKSILDLGLKKIEKGAFSQIIISQKGNNKITYSEWVQGMPVIKNTEAKYYYGEVYRPELGHTVSGNRLETPGVLERNIDILPIPVISKYQTCADTQLYLRGLYELEEEFKTGVKDKIEFKISNGKTLSYNKDGTYTIWDGKQVVTKNYKKDIRGSFDDWMTNVQAYTNTGSLRDSLKTVSEIDNLKPGDILTLHPDPKTGYGHTIGIKEILEIPPGSGNIYYRKFAGSDPAIDAVVYQGLISKQELIAKLKNRDAVVLTWDKE